MQRETSHELHDQQSVDLRDLLEESGGMTEQEKPTILYHSSLVRDIQEFEPRAETTRDVTEGPVVFATPDKGYASMFMVPTDDSWTAKGRFTTDGKVEPWHIVISDRERFNELDIGGMIYILNPSSFISDPDRNMHSIEWTSKNAVIPIGGEEYASALEAMYENGVNVFFTDLETFNRISMSDDHGRAIIHSLGPVVEL